MQLKQNSIVKTADGQTVGRVSHFVINPKDQGITHLIVEKGFFFLEDRVVPITSIQSATQDEISLKASAGNKPEDFALFEHAHYVRPDEYSTEPEAFPPLSTYYYYPPIVGSVGPTVVAAPHEHINDMERDEVAELPDESVAVRKGADVYTNDNTLIGQVDEVFTSQQGPRRVTHFVISQGLLMKKYKLIPVHWISQMSTDRLDLGVTRDVIDKLPDYTN